MRTVPTLGSSVRWRGWNAEDLELPLLDERMVMVNMDPDLSPSCRDVVSKKEGIDIRKKFFPVTVDP